MRATLEALVRVATYANAASLVSTGATLEQLRLAQRPGVLYLDGGWQSLVDATAEAARVAGARLRTGTRVTAAVREGSTWRVAFDDAPALSCGAIVLATGPAAARSIVASEALAAWAERTIPAHVACLDVALVAAPRGTRDFRSRRRPAAVPLGAFEDGAPRARRDGAREHDEVPVSRGAPRSSA